MKAGKDTKVSTRLYQRIFSVPTLIVVSFALVTLMSISLILYAAQQKQSSSESKVAIAKIHSDARATSKQGATDQQSQSSQNNQGNKPSSKQPDGISTAAPNTTGSSSYQPFQTGVLSNENNLPPAMNGTTYPAQSFNVTSSSPLRTDGSDTITYSVTLTIVPVVAGFGNPSITAHIYFAPACENTGSLSKTIQYSPGNNTITLNCVVTRIMPYVVGQSVPPLPSATSFTIEVYGQIADGTFIYGMPGTAYVLPSGYDR